MEENQDKIPESTTEPFKKPVLIGRIGKLPKKATTAPEKPPEKHQEEKKVPEESKSESLPQVSSTTIGLTYKEPKWSGLCPDGSDYALEILKSGMIVERLDLTSQPFFVFGRLPDCDVVMAHPTISRHHCVLQYKAFAEANEPTSGWYLYDLGSTHGTFLNKERLRPSHYTRARVGHQIKFGNSTRTYILTGPHFDCEGESELSVTEIKQRAQDMKLERDRLIREAKEQREKDRLEAEKKREEQGIDWGMGEDAEDETDLSENPFAVTTNEELYLTDPKKTLRGYFEREGHELQYDCEERAQGQYICKVELPMDDARGRPVVAEAIHTGKKKEAVVACALEACRILDRAGLLRQAKHESRRRKERDWSADDYYDSDDDNYLDRTGQVESKRRVRMQRSGALPQAGGALTHDQLLKQISDIECKMAAEERTLARLRESTRQRRDDAVPDDLDQYMATLAAPTMSVKAEISTAKMALQKLKGELSKTQRLAELARPAHLPPLVKKDDSKLVKLNSVVYGKRIKLKTDAEKKPIQRKEKKQEEGEFVEEVDSDDEDTSKKQKTEATNDLDNSQEDTSQERRKKNEEVQTDRRNLDNKTENNEKKKCGVIGEADSDSNRVESDDSGKKSEDVGKKSDVSGKKSEDVGKKSDVSGKKSEDVGKKSDVSGKKSEDVGKKSDVSGKKSEDVGKKSDVSGKKSEDVGKKSDVSGKKSEDVGKKSDVSGKKSEDVGKKSDVSGKKSEDVGKKSDVSGKKSEDVGKKSDDNRGEKSKNDSKKMYGPMRPPDNYVIPDDYFEQESTRDLPEIMEE